MSTTNIDDLASMIVKELENYSQDVTDELKKAVDIVAVEVNKEIKNHVTFTEHSGKYVKSFRIKKTFENKFSKTNTWHVVNGQYRLTHLLENGHALKQGGRTEAFPHIKFGEELARKRMEELTKEAIENVGR